ncbi:MAG: eukaryotic-like serine/threonine-protein kinase [Myxococcales bacterium]|nr:eukaryotic-like serine/threonine-protein kinase [Myxococcales bacterium]
MRLIRAALLHGVAPVDLPETHLQAGVHILQVRLRGKPVVVLSAELAGETATGSFALRLMPLDPSHVPELTAITESDDDEIPASRGPMSATASAIFDSEPPLPPGASLPFPLEEDELEASVLFDPEAALISRAPARPDGTGPEDTLTIPVRASMMPPGAGAVPPSARAAPPPRRPPSGPHTISHLSIPSSIPATERQEPSISITVDFDTSQSNVHTERERPEEWTAEDGAAASDPSLGESVVFDPDVLAREQHSGGQKPSRPAGSMVTPDEELSLTPTMPMDVPPRRPPSLRREPSSRRSIDMDEVVNEDAETYPRSAPGYDSSPSQSVPSQGVMSRDGGPRTMRRTTGAHGIVIVGRVIANRYRIESLVGAGAIGAVYKASHVDLPRTFAIKVLHPHFRADPQLLASFRTEARAASLLDHPNVTVVHDFGEEPDGLVYIVMEYLAGVNLQAVLDEERRLEPRRAIRIMAQVCSALSAAHERGIVHRDVKPDNIMLVPSRDDEGRPFEMVKVCDFGIAALETPGMQPGASREWTAGTPEYMAPEQAQGHADARTDVYACGIVLYEMLTGRPPFVGDSPAATLAKHATELPRRPSEIVPGFLPGLEPVILCAIEKSPMRRFPSVRDLRTELKRLL